MERKRGISYWSIFLIWILLLGLLGTAGASPIFETTAFITGTEGHVYELDLDDQTGSSRATLSDLCSADLEFESLMLLISTSEEIVGCVSEAGLFDFYMEADKAYFANVFGLAGGNLNTGLYGLRVSHTPIPNSFLLLFAGLLGLISIRRRIPGQEKRKRRLKDMEMLSDDF